MYALLPYGSCRQQVTIYGIPNLAHFSIKMQKLIDQNRRKEDNSPIYLEVE